MFGGPRFKRPDGRVLVNGIHFFRVGGAINRILSPHVAAATPSQPDLFPLSTTHCPLLPLIVPDAPPRIRSQELAAPLQRHGVLLWSRRATQPTVFGPARAPASPLRLELLRQITHLRWLPKRHRCALATHFREGGQNREVGRTDAHKKWLLPPQTSGLRGRVGLGKWSGPGCRDDYGELTAPDCRRNHRTPPKVAPRATVR